MGGNVPKQFAEMGGIPVLQRTISAFLDACPDASVITVLPADHIEDWRDLCVRHAFDIPQTLVKGGITRFHSVKNALHKVPDGAIVAVQDGVRPFLKPSMLKAMLEKAETEPAVIPALPVTDTLKFKDGALPDPDRSAVVAVQTPQIFHSEVLKGAYDTAYDRTFTDDASVVAKAGVKIELFPGDKWNIKLTTPEDLALARFIISEGL